MKVSIATLVFIVLWLPSFGQEREEISFLRINDDVTIDGELNESFWSTCEKATGFKQNIPLTGEPATQTTHVKVVYDDDAFYVGAELFDRRDSMSLTLSQRDDFGNADWFGVIVDPYNAGTIGFAFLVTSAGVQIDELHNVEGIDNNWNAVWQSKVKVHDDRWVVEIKIPFSAIRFPKKEIQSWGVNFMRNIRRNREQAYWNFFDPRGVNLISQLGVATGIENIESPIRLSFIPYVSGYVENYEGVSGYSLNGGMDLKYGLNEAFTLDMTLIPDFGQVQFDQQVLNLSPFEVQFNENRPFFIEGTELFTKQGLFYSRRVGGVPLGAGGLEKELDTNEVIVENPGVTQLINATKLSGRTRGGTGIGVFNAVTAVTEGRINDTILQRERIVETSPLSNYNVFVIDQNLKNNSSITLTNTNVWRSGSVYDANVTALGTSIFTSETKYKFWGTGILSQRYEDTTTNLGYKTAIGLGKVSGNFLWSLDYDESNDTYDQNDLGFQLNNNKRNFVGRINYNIYEPFWRLYRMWTSLSVNYGRLVKPDAFSNFSVELNANGTFRNFMTSGFWLEVAPVRDQDWFEPRVSGRHFKKDENVNFGGFISSDYSKPFALDANTSLTLFNENNRYSTSVNVSPRFRFNDRFSMIYDYSYLFDKNDEGVALTQSFNIVLIGNDPVFGKRDRTTVINRLTADYIFTNRMGITFSLRHYWSKVEYNTFFVLNQNGDMITSAYMGNDTESESVHNNSYNAFTIDMVYRWVFAPGSELSLVWKNSIFKSTNDVSANYFTNVEELIADPATNGLSLKVLYYIDFYEAKKQLRGRF